MPQGADKRPAAYFGNVIRSVYNHPGRSGITVQSASWQKPSVHCLPSNSDPVPVTQVMVTPYAEKMVSEDYRSSPVQIGRGCREVSVLVVPYSP